MSTDLLERTETFEVVDTEHTPKKSGPDEPDEFLHLFKKDDLVENMLSGKTIVAMCGFTKTGVAHPNLAGHPVCPTCRFIYEAKDDWVPSEPEDGHIPL